MRDPRNISIRDYNYQLPDERIARYPLTRRDGSRLLVWKKGVITDTDFRRAVDFLPHDSCLVFNQSRVIRARLFFTTPTGSPVEIFCLEPAGNGSSDIPQGKAVWKCMVGRLKNWKSGKLALQTPGISLWAEVLQKEEDHVIVAFYWDPQKKTFGEVLEAFGSVPVPPYLGRDSETIDLERYQTVYAKDDGSVAAPTAGLHFTDDVISDLERRGIGREFLTLHVGSGTFRPVKADRLGDHPMHSEIFTVTRATLEKLIQHPLRKIIAVGTTSLRALESLYWLGVKSAKLQPGVDYSVEQWEPYLQESGTERTEALQALLGYMTENRMESLTCRTAILIAPPYKLRVCSGLFTNFHQPASTLLLLVAAVAGDDWKRIYHHALDNGYRFLSYGDSSLLLP